MAEEAEAPAVVEEVEMSVLDALKEVCRINCGTNFLIDLKVSCSNFLHL